MPLSFSVGNSCVKTGHLKGLIGSAISQQTSKSHPSAQRLQPCDANGPKSSMQ